MSCVASSQPLLPSTKERMARKAPSSILESTKFRLACAVGGMVAVVTAGSFLIYHRAPTASVAKRMELVSDAVKYQIDMRQYLLDHKNEGTKVGEQSSSLLNLLSSYEKAEREGEKHADKADKAAARGLNTISWSQFTYFDSGAYQYGNTRNGELHGYAVYVHHDGTRFEGEWEYDRPSGHLVVTYPDACRYAGQWRWTASQLHTWAGDHGYTSTGITGYGVYNGWTYECKGKFQDGILARGRLYDAYGYFWDF